MAKLEVVEDVKNEEVNEPKKEGFIKKLSQKKWVKVANKAIGYLLAAGVGFVGGMKYAGSTDDIEDEPTIEEVAE